MQTTAIRTVANSLPEKGVILLTLLISDRYILFAELRNIFDENRKRSSGGSPVRGRRCDSVETNIGKYSVKNGNGCRTMAQLRAQVRLSRI